MSQLPPGLVVGCTNRKRVQSTEELQAFSLPYTGQDQLETAWRQRLLGSPQTTRARNLYCGRGFYEAQMAATYLGGPLWVVSAGLGLVNSYDRVPSYDLTLAPGTKQSIQSHVSGSDFDAYQWWRAVNPRASGLPPLASLVEQGAPRGRCFIFSLSSQYLNLIAKDLLEIPDTARESIRLLCRRELSDELSALAPCSFVYGDVLDGPDSPLPGTGADFASRMARHFAENVWCKAPHSTVDTHQQLLRSCLAGFRSPTQPKRSRRSDDEIVDLIHNFWEHAGGRSSRILRLLRDEQLIACEQGRFRQLFYRAAAQRAGQ